MLLLADDEEEEERSRLEEEARAAVLVDEARVVSIALRFHALIFFFLVRGFFRPLLLGRGCWLRFF